MATSFADETETTVKEDPNRPLDSYFVEELTAMLHESTLQVLKSIERRNEIRQMIERKYMQVSENTTEADHQFQGALNPQHAPQEGMSERSRF